jgi:hypothetical protein
MDNDLTPDDKKTLNQLYDDFNKSFPLKTRFKWWFNEVVIYRLPTPIKHAYWDASRWFDTNIRYRLFPRNQWARKAIPREYCDLVEMLPIFLYASIISFVEGEKCFETIDWDATPDQAEFAKKLKECYVWAKQGRKDYQEAILKEYPPNNSVSNSMGLHEDGKPYEVESDGSPLWSGEQIGVAYIKVNSLEERFEKIDTQWLNWIIMNRGYLWT